MFRQNLQHTGVSSETVAPPLTSAWKFKTGGSVNSSPTVVDGIVYVGSNDGNVYALDATTGAKKWSYTIGSPVGSSPGVSGGIVYVGADNWTIYALDAKTGAKLWNHKTGDSVYPSPTVSVGTVYIGSGDANVYAFAQGATSTCPIGNSVAAIMSAAAMILPLARPFVARLMNVTPTVLGRQGRFHCLNGRFSYLVTRRI